MDGYGLNIETPEQVRVRFDIAGIGSRFVALALDMLIQTALYLVLVFAGFSWILDGTGASWYTAAMIIAAVFVFYIYFMLFEVFWKGKTPGKAAMGIQVVHISGRPAGAGSVLVRNLFRILDFLPALYAVGVVSMFATEQSRRVGDLVAGTIVVRRGRRGRVKLEQIVPQQSAQTPPAGPSVVSGTRIVLTADEFGIVKDYMARAPGMKLRERVALATRLAAPLYAKYQVTGEIRLDPEGFLREIYEQNR